MELTRPTAIPAIFALTLRKGLDNPFAPRNDSAANEDDKDADKTTPTRTTKAAKEKPKPAAEIDDRIDFDGIDQRLVRAPIDPGQHAPGSR